MATALLPGRSLGFMWSDASVEITGRASFAAACPFVAIRRGEYDMKKRLKDIANIRAGYQFRGKVTPDEAGTVRVIQIKDVDATCQIQIHDLISVNIARPEPHLLQAGDVLFLSRGPRQYAVVLADLPGDTIATSYFFVLRLTTDMVTPAYLAWHLNQPEFQEALKPVVRGTHMPLVSRSDFEVATVEIPPLEIQDRIVKLNDLLNQDRRLSQELYEKRAVLVAAISRQAAREN